MGEKVEGGSDESDGHRQIHAPEGSNPRRHKSVPEGSSVTAGDALPNAYQKLREEVGTVIEDEQREEFERLFPPWSRPSTAGSVRGGFDPLRAAAATNEARALLGQLAGWLEGFVSEVRMKLEADAYAKERVKQERGIGFGPAKPPD